MPVEVVFKVFVLFAIAYVFQSHSRITYIGKCKGCAICHVAILTLYNFVNDRVS